MNARDSVGSPSTRLVQSRVNIILILIEVQVQYDDIEIMRRSAILYLGLSGFMFLGCQTVLIVILFLDSDHTNLLRIPQTDGSINSGGPPVQCGYNPDDSRSVIDKIMVAPSPLYTRDRILCFMMTHSGSHKTKVSAVMETWGSKCDGWLIASNQTDDALGSRNMQTPALYTQLWAKLNETVHLIASESINDYDWFFKVDDDTFVIMENLWYFLKTRHRDKKTPQIFGYLLTDQFWGDQRKYFELDRNKAFGDHFLSHIRDPKAKVDYLAGGSGYIMNRAYLGKLVLALESNLTLSGEVPEDMAHGATMLAHGIEPFDSRDTAGRQHFIPESPALWNVRHQAHTRSGAVKANRNCCARYTISFHHLSPWMIQYLYQQFYLCRTTSTAG